MELKLWKRADNYAGTDFSDYYCGPGRGRDSEILEQSNFEVALEMLGGESEKVIVAHSSHWACGWVEQILVHKSAKAKLKVLADIASKLSDYPVLDESDYSEREHEYYAEYAESEKHSLANALSLHFGVRDNKPLADIAYQLNMEEQYSNGADSCINIYSVRKPEKRDIDQLHRALQAIKHQFERSRTFKHLNAVVSRLKVNAA